MFETGIIFVVTYSFGNVAVHIEVVKIGEQTLPVVKSW